MTWTRAGSSLLLLAPVLILYLLLGPLMAGPGLRNTTGYGRLPPPAPISEPAVGVPGPTPLPSPGELFPTPGVINSGPVGVPILMYHYIRINPDPSSRIGYSLSVTARDFAAQMDWLRRAGFTPIDFSDLFGFLQGSEVLPARPIILTFDDGYADFYTTAYPILRDHGYKAVTYVITHFLGQPNYMTSGQLVALDAAGIEIASHTVDHLDLTTISADRLRREVGDARTYLQNLLGHPVLDFCYPAGRYNAAVVGAVAAAGYRSATTTQLAYTHSLANRFLWGRVRVSGGETLAQFAAALGG